MKRSEKITLASLVAGSAVGLLSWWYFPDLHWGWHAAAGFISFCIIDAAWMSAEATARQVDRDP